MSTAPVGYEVLEHKEKNTCFLLSSPLSRGAFEGLLASSLVGSHLSLTFFHRQPSMLLNWGLQTLVATWDRQIIGRIKAIHM